MRDCGVSLSGPCPQCGASWDAGEIPEEYHQYYSPPYRYSRLVGVEDSAVYDGVLYYECPDCKEQFHRFAPT